MADITYCIKTCNKFKDTRLKACLETWAKDVDPFILGDATELDVLEGHDNLTKKLRRYFLCNPFTPGNFLMLVDDDTYVNVPALKEFVSTLDPWLARSYGRGIMPTQQFVKYSRPGPAVGIQPKLSCNQTCSGVLISYPMIQAIQMVCWMKRDPDFIFADDQWLSATIGTAKHLSAVHFGKPIYREVSAPDKFLAKSTKQGNELIASGSAFSLSCETEERMRLVHDMFLTHQSSKETVTTGQE